MSTEVKSRAKRGSPCEVCGSATKGCSLTTDGLRSCRGEPARPDDWKKVSGPDDVGFRHYRPASEARVGSKPAPKPKITSTAKPTTKSAELRTKGRAFAGNFDKHARAGLAANLGLPVAAVQAIPGTGFTEYGGKDADEKWVAAWTFPMTSGSGAFVGLAKRFAKPIPIDGELKNKIFMGGSEHGLFLPKEWKDRAAAGGRGSLWRA